MRVGKDCFVCTKCGNKVVTQTGEVKAIEQDDVSPIEVVTIPRMSKRTSIQAQENENDA